MRSSILNHTHVYLPHGNEAVSLQAQLITFALAVHAMNTLVRLNGLVTLAFTLIMIAFLVVIISQAKADIPREISANMGIVSALLQQFKTTSEVDINELNDELSKLQQIRHLRLVFLGPSGLIYFDSHSKNEPDIPTWFSRLIWDPDTKTAKQEFVIGNNTVLIIGYPEDELGEVWESTIRVLILMLICAVLSNIAVYWGGRLSLRPINHFLLALDEIQKGHFEARLKDYSLPEAQRLSEHFNRMAKALELQQQTNRGLTRELIDLQENERKQLARELHDDLGQHLSAIKALAYTIRHSAKESDPIVAHAEKIVHNSGSILSSFRNIIARLRPVILDRVTIYDACLHLCKEWSEQVGIECAFTQAEQMPKLNEEQSIHIYRIVQEALNNITKHAEATTANIEFTASDNNDKIMQLRISDNGKGWDQQQLHQGRGLLFMQERARALQGTLAIETSPGDGATLNLAVPVDAPITHGETVNESVNH